MSVFLAPNMILRASAVVTAGNQVALVTRHYRVVSVGAPAATDQDFADVYSAAIAAPLKALMENNASFKGVLAQVIVPRPPASDVISISGAGLGSAGATPLPRQVSGILSLFTNTAGRAFRGRAYIPFPSASDLSNTAADTPTAGYQTRMNTLGNAIFTLTAIAVAGRTATVAGVIFHRALLSSTDILGFSSPLKWATQRRRGNYGQANNSPI